jgi:integrase
VAHIQKRGPSRYRVRYVDPAGRERSKTFARQRDAERFRATVEADVLRGQYVDAADRTTVADYARQWALNRPHRATTARRVDSIIRVHIAGTSLGQQRLVAVRPSDVQAWATGRAAVLSPSTLRTVCGVLQSVFRAAAQDRLIASSPVVRLVLPPNQRPRVTPLTVEEVQRLAHALPARNAAMVIVQAGLGLRLGELLALRLKNVDFLRRTVSIVEQIAPGTQQRTEPKTPRSRRILPMPDVVALALAQHVAEFPPGPDGTIFTTRAGRPYRHDYYGSGIFRRGVKAAGLAEGTTSHDLRHHYASVLLAAGESVVAVAERLGHENATLVLKVYGHLMPGREDHTRQAIDTAWGDSDGLQTAQEK